jgi:Spx/MgsR family transcriptional regulator
VIIYIHPKCSTCKEALRFLESRKVTCTVKDITQTPPTVAELQAMLDYKNGDVKKLFNSSGQLYREMELSTKLPSMSLQAVLTLLSQHGMLVKRPFLLGKDFGLTGFNAATWAKVL